MEGLLSTGPTPSSFLICLSFRKRFTGHQLTQAASANERAGVKHCSYSANERAGLNHGG